MLSASSSDEWPAITPSPADGPDPSSLELAYRERHRQLLQVLAAHIDEFGYDTTQINDIARVANISKRTFYEHFGTKEMALAELLRRAERAMYRGLVDAAVVGLPQGAEATFHGMVAAWAGLLRGGPALSRLARKRASTLPMIAEQRDVFTADCGRVFALAAQRLGSPLTPEEMGSVGLLVAWGVWGAMSNDILDREDIDSELQSLARAICRAFHV